MPHFQISYFVVRSLFQRAAQLYIHCIKFIHLVHKVNSNLQMDHEAKKGLEMYSKGSNLLKQHNLA